MRRITAGWTDIFCPGWNRECDCKIPAIRTAGEMRRVNDHGDRAFGRVCHAADFSASFRNQKYGCSSDDNSPGCRGSYVEISGKNPAKAGLMRKIFLSDSTKGISFFVFPSVTAGGERRSFPGDGEKQFCSLLRSTCDFRVMRYARKVILVPNSLLFCHRENTRNSGM